MHDHFVKVNYSYFIFKTVVRLARVIGVNATLIILTTTVAFELAYHYDDASS